MKYFMSVWSPSRGMTRIFWMSLESAKYYYDDYLRKHSDIYRKRCLEGGASVKAPHTSIRIWGEDISEQEIFKRRLVGTVDKETLEA